MAKVRKKLDLGILLKPTDVATTKEGEIRIGATSKFVHVYTDGAERELLSADQSQTVTNKSIDADNNTISNLEVDNLKAGVLNTDLSGAATDTEIPSALAVKTALAGQNEASEIAYDNSTSGLAATDVQAAIDEVEGRVDSVETLAGNADTKIDDHIADATSAHAASAISNTPSGNLAATDVQGALNELQTDVDTRVVDGGSFTSGSVITPSRLDVKQDTLANLTTYAGSASNGQLVFATDELKMYQIIGNALQPVGGASGTTIEIDQVAHGFAVGDGIYHNGTNWAKGQANDAATLATFVVTEVPDVDSFVAYQFGRVEVTAHGFTVGEYYFLSNSVAGQPTSTEPTSDFSNPLFYVEDANILQILVYRPSVVGNQTAIDELSDVSAPSPNDGEVLTYVTANNRWEAVPAAGDAADITYDNSGSTLVATDTESAIDELDGKAEANEASITTNASNISSNDDDIRDLQKIKNINYIDNPDFEVDASGYTGDTNLTIARSTSDPLRGVASGLISKAAVDAQDETVKVPFTIDAADNSQKLYISFDKEISAAHADGDMRVEIEADPNGTPFTIRCNGEDLQGTDGKHLAWFQADASIVEYNLVFKVVTTNASAYTIKIDNVSVGPREAAFGSAMTDWKSYTPTISNLTLNATGKTDPTGWYKREGDSAKVRVLFVNGSGGAATGSGDILIGLPDGLSIDTSKVNSFEHLGSATPFSINSSSTFESEIGVVYRNASGGIALIKADAGARLVASDITASAEMYIEFSVPIQGWSSNSLMSEDIGNREIRVRGAGNSGAAITANTEAIDFTLVEDTTGSWSQEGVHGPDTFTAPETGNYIVTGMVYYTSAVNITIDSYINGTIDKRLGFDATSTNYQKFDGVVTLEKGDALTIRSNSLITLSNLGNQLHWIHIQKLAQPQTILETETVAARYTSVDNSSVANANNFIFSDKVFDTHNAYNTSTGKYEVPVTGYYTFTAKIRSTSNTSFLCTLEVNGTEVDRFSEYSDVSGTDRTMQLVSIIYVEKGDLVQFQNNSGGARNRTANAQDNVLSMIRMK